MNRVFGWIAVAALLLGCSKESTSSDGSDRGGVAGTTGGSSASGGQDATGGSGNDGGEATAGSSGRGGGQDATGGSGEDGGRSATGGAGDVGGQSASGGDGADGGVGAGGSGPEPQPCVPADCSGHGTCATTGACSCNTGWSGTGCDTCAVGFSGPTCEATPTGDAPAASVAVGVAPLGVFFDATAVADLANDDYLNAQVVWQFGDPGSGTYVTTGNVKNIATGFVAAHVFEQPGEYEVYATVVDSAGSTFVTRPVTITVREFSGESRCISTGTDFSGAPSGCSTQTTTNLDDQLSWLAEASNRRLLLRRGDSWSTNGVLLNGSGPALLGAFGSGAAPVISGNCDTTLSIYGSDTRVTDVELVGLQLELNGSDSLVLRVNAHDVLDDGDCGGIAVGMGGDGLFLADSSILDNGYFSVYAAGSRLSVTGSHIHQIRVATRFPPSDPLDSRDVFVTNNLIGASREEPTTGIKWHSRRGVITDNVMVAGLSRIALSVDSGEAVEAVDDGLGVVLIERNVFRTSIDDADPVNDAHTDCGVVFSANDHIVIRNNLAYNMSRAFCVGDEPRPTHDVSIYNNSVYKGANRGPNHDEGDFIRLNGNAEGLRAFNNVVYVENDDADAVVVKVVDVPLAQLVDHEFANNIYYVTGKPLRFALFDDHDASLEDWQARGLDAGSRITDPLYRSTDVTSDDFLRLQASSPAIDAGTAVPVFYDFALTPRDAAIDIGAFEAH